MPTTRDKKKGKKHLYNNDKTFYKKKKRTKAKDVKQNKLSQCDRKLKSMKKPIMSNLHSKTSLQKTTS